MKPGDIVLVRFPFTSIETTKKRPALVLAATSLGKRVELVALAMITSRTDGVALRGDVSLADWKRAGLLHPSLVRLAKIATLDHALVERKIGSLTEVDLAAVQSGFVRVFRFWMRPGAG